MCHNFTNYISHSTNQLEGYDLTNYIWANKTLQSYPLITSLIFDQSDF